MAYTYTLASGSVPVPVGGTLSTIGTGASGEFTPGISTPFPYMLNQLAAAQNIGAVNGGPGCYGIISGFTLTAGSGLTVSVGVGVGWADQPIELVSSGAVYGTFQFNVPAALTLAASSTNRIWLTATGTLVTATTITPPTGAKIFLGAAITDGSGVTSIDGSGIVDIINGIGIRRTADLWGPTDTPSNCGAVFTQTTYGTYVWANSKWLRLRPDEADIQTIGTSLVLTADSPRTQWITASAGSLSITLPDASTLLPGDSFTIYNPGATNSFTIKSHGGTTITTLAVGDYASYPVIPYSSGNGFPASVSGTAIPSGTN